MPTLQIIETAYRATLEEQDDPIVWLTHAMRGAGAELSVLLRGNAVNYAVRTQDSSNLHIGDWTQREPPRLANDLLGLMGKGVPVHAVAEDLAQRGIAARGVIDGIQSIPHAKLASFIAGHERVWHW